MDIIEQMASDLAAQGQTAKPIELSPRDAAGNPVAQPQLEDPSLMHISANLAPDAPKPDILAQMNADLATPNAAPTAAQSAAAAPPSTNSASGNLAYGAVKGLADLPYGISQGAMHLGAMLPGAAGQYMQGKSNEYDQFLNDQENEYQRDTKGSIAAGLGRFGGNIAMPVPGAMAAKGALTVAADAPKLAALLNAGARGVATGGITGALQPVYNSSDYSGDKASQALVGGALGVAAPTLVGGAKALYNGTIRPIVNPSGTAADQIANFINSAPQSEADKAMSASAAALGPSQNAPANLGTNGVWSGSGAPTGANAMSNALANPNIGGFVSSPADVLARVQSAPQFVPGSLPTTAQVAGSPELVMAEKALRNNPAYTAQFLARANANNQARMDVVNQVAQTPEALAAAKALRTSTATPLYDQFKAQTFPVSDKLQGLLETPIGQAAIARAQNEAKNAQTPFVLTPATKATPASMAQSSILDANGNPLSGASIAAQAAQPGTMDGYSANLVKMAVDAMKKDKVTYGVGSHEANTLGDISNSLVGQMDAAAPVYGQARAAYAAGSVPVNTMEVGQQLKDALSSGTMNSSGEAAPALSIYRNKLAQALKSSKYGIDPDAQASLKGVQDDLQRATVSDSVKLGNSDTAYNLQAPNWLASKLYGDSYNGKSPIATALGGIGGFITGGPTGAAGGAFAAQKMGQVVGSRINDQLAKALLDPNYFSQILAKKLEDEKAAQAVNSAFQRSQTAVNPAQQTP